MCPSGTLVFLATLPMLRKHRAKLVAANLVAHFDPGIFRHSLMGVPIFVPRVEKKPRGADINAPCVQQMCRGSRLFAGAEREPPYDSAWKC